MHSEKKKSCGFIGTSKKKNVFQQINLTGFGVSSFLSHVYFFSDLFVGMAFWVP